MWSALVALVALVVGVVLTVLLVPWPTCGVAVLAYHVGYGTGVWASWMQARFRKQDAERCSTT